jgi:hypothetical protein
LLNWLFSPVGVLIAGIVVAAVGSSMTWEGHYGKLPERTELTQVSGVVKQVVKETKTKHNVPIEVKYKISLVEGRELVLDREQITEDAAASLNDQNVKAELLDNDGRDVWALSAGATSVVNYETTHRKRVESQAKDAQEGPYVLGVGVALALFGGVWWKRRRATY